MNPTRVVIENVAKTFFNLRGNVEALSDINIEIEPGEFFVLLGASGSGKTILLKLISDFGHINIRLDEPLATRIREKTFRKCFPGIRPEQVETKTLPATDLFGKRYSRALDPENFLVFDSIGRRIDLS